MRLLVVEDDRRIRQILISALEAGGFIVDFASDGEEAWFLGDTEDYAAVILDLGLPNMDGMAILKKWRAGGRAFPVLILTARGSWTERVEGIDAGADDYLAKPFEVAELMARLRAVLRRTGGHASANISIGSIDLDPRHMQVTKSGVPIGLSPQEYRLVSYMMHHSDRVVTQQELSEHLQAEHFERESNAVEVLVGRVRRKIGPGFIETRRGFGYILSAGGQ
jgi:two-component system, OmpR family, response regulator